MGRKSSDGSGVGADLLHVLGLTKLTNSTDDSEFGDNKGKNQSRFGRFRFSKSKKKTNKTSIGMGSGKISMDIDLRRTKDNREIEQANEKTSTSSLVDVQISLETVLEEMEKSLTNIKKNVDVAETCLEDVYISVDKLEKFSELCKVENEDVILGLHKLVNVYKGAALLSTFSTDPTFKKNYDYNITDTDGKSTGKRSEGHRSVETTSVKESECESVITNPAKTQDSNNSEVKPIILKSKSYNSKSSLITKKTTVSDNTSMSRNTTLTLNSEHQNSNKTTKTENITGEKLDSAKNNNIVSSNKTNNDEEGTKEKKISKTEKFKEKLNFKIKKKKKNLSDNNDIDSADAGNSSSCQSKIERFKKKFDKKSK